MASKFLFTSSRCELPYQLPLLISLRRGLKSQIDCLNNLFDFLWEITMDLIKAIEEGQKRSYTTQFRVGDTVKVYFKIIEGKTERIQVYEGVVLCIKNSGARKTFTVRKESYGVGVERVFPINSPRIVKVEIVRVGKVRRAKLCCLRGGIGKGKKIKERLGGEVASFISEQNRNAENAAHAQEEALKAEHNAEHAAAEAKK